MTDIPAAMPAIQSCVLFRGIPLDKSEKLIENAVSAIKEYDGKQMILGSGSTTDELGVILHGSVFLEYNDNLGNRTIIRELSPGEILCGSYSFDDTAKAIFDAAAHKSCSVAFLNKKKLIDSCTDSSVMLQLTQNLLSIVIEHTRSHEHKLRNICQRSTRSKLMVYLLEQSELQQSHKITLDFNRQELADYLCVDRSAMTKELNRMRNDGLIDFDGNTFTLNRESL